jgi:hypothetical protein
MTHPMQLVTPSLDRLPSYVAALKRGWSPDNTKGAAASIEELAHIEKDPRSFVESLTDLEAKGPPIVPPDGSSAARLPDLDFGFGIPSFAGPLVCGGSRTHQSCHLTSSDTLAMRLCRGRKAAAMPS